MKYTLIYYFLLNSMSQRTNLTPYWIYSFSSNLWALLTVLSHAGSAPL